MSKDDNDVRVEAAMNRADPDWKKKAAERIAADIDRQLLDEAIAGFEERWKNRESDET